MKFCQSVEELKGKCINHSKAKCVIQSGENKRQKRDQREILMGFILTFLRFTVWEKQQIKNNALPKTFVK